MIRKASEEGKKLRAIFESSPNAITVTDLEGKITECNQATLDTHGFSSKGELIGMSAFQLIAEEDRQRAMENLKRTLEKGSVRNIEYTLLTSYGLKFPAELSASVIRDSRGNLTGFVAITKNITERKEAERRRTTEERLSALNLYGRKLSTSTNLQEVFETTLDAMEQTLGFEYASFAVVDGSNLRVACHRGYPDPLFVVLPLDGTMRGITVKAANTHRPLLVHDTRENEDYVEGSPDIRSELAVPIETEGRVLGVLNVESGTLGAFDDKDVMLLQILASHAATAISNMQKRKEIERRSNQLAWLMKSSTRMISSTDMCQRLQTIAEAIRELGWRRVVISARDKNMEIVSPIDIVTAGLTEEETRFLWENKPPGQVWGERLGLEYERFKLGEFYHLPWDDPWVRKRFSDSTIPSKLQPGEMVDWNPQDLLYAPLRLANGRIVGMLSIDDPLDGRRPTGDSLAPLELFIHQAAVAIENAQLFQSLNEAKEQLKADAELLEQKVEERTRELEISQRQLLQAQKLAAVGELAGMVGHDLRNPLTGIASAAYYLKSKLGQEANEEITEMLDLIEKDIKYSNKIISDLLEYSREVHIEPTETTPGEVMKEALGLIRVPDNVQIVNLTKSETRVEMDIEKTKRVFVNIIKNAIDAMPKGGKLTISSKEQDNEVQITFTDTGTGIPDEIKGRIFTPLFTTKAKGLGLGLPICRRIVEAQRGHISMRSTVGMGTTFTITLPTKPQPREDETICVNLQEPLSVTKKA